MGQLIKMQDYVSRYEQDLYRYSSQFVRLKKQQWTKLKEAYFAGELDQWTIGSQIEEDHVQEEEAPEKKRMIQKVISYFGKVEENQVEEVAKEKVQDEFALETFLFQTPKNLDELKKLYLNQLMRFQLKWASSTITQKSFFNKAYLFDERLTFFLQRFPDNCLLMYQPVFLLKNARVELDIILLTPTEVWCLTFLEGEQDAVYVGSRDRFWTRKHHRLEDKKVLNPSISLNRMEKIVKSIFEKNEIDLPIKKAILCRSGYIDEPNQVFNVTYLDKREFPNWFEKMRTNTSPLKNQQLKAAKALLEYCNTTFIKRLEWEELDDGERNEAGDESNSDSRST